MKDISLHILDIVQNSIFANATFVRITILENMKDDFLKVVIEDNGCGMNDDTAKKVYDPFFTSKEGKRFGLGIPLLKASTEVCGGNLKIVSKLGAGTKIEATFIPSNVDCIPLGDIAATMLSLVAGTENVDFLYEHRRENKIFSFDTIKIREVLDGVSINEPRIYRWLSEFISEGEKEVMKED